MAKKMADAVTSSYGLWISSILTLVGIVGLYII